MEYQDRSQVTQFVSGLILGVVIGAGVALLSAPESGSRTRRRLHRAATDVRDQAGDRFEEVSGEVRERVGHVVGQAKKRIRR